MYTGVGQHTLPNIVNHNFEKKAYPATKLVKEYQLIRDKFSPQLFFTNLSIVHLNQLQASLCL